MIIVTANCWGWGREPWGWWRFEGSLCFVVRSSLLLPLAELNLIFLSALSSDYFLSFFLPTLSMSCYYFPDLNLINFLYSSASQIWGRSWWSEVGECPVKSYRVAVAQTLHLPRGAASHAATRRYCAASACEGVWQTAERHRLLFSWGESVGSWFYIHWSLVGFRVVCVAFVTSIRNYCYA